MTITITILEKGKFVQPQLAWKDEKKIFNTKSTHNNGL